MPPIQRSTFSRPVVVVLTPLTITFAQVPVPDRKVSRSAGTGKPGEARPVTIDFAAERFPATVAWFVMVVCFPYAATKLTNDSSCRSANRNSNQFLYAASVGSFVTRLSCRRTSLSGGRPSLLPAARLIAGRSSGRPTRGVLTQAGEKSSRSLPTWLERARKIAP